MVRPQTIVIPVSCWTGAYSINSYSLAAKSIEVLLTRLMTAALEVLYTHIPGSPRMPEVDAVTVIAEPGRIAEAHA